MTIYDRITRLPPTVGAHRRLHLPCIVYPVKRLLRHQGSRYYAKTSVLGEVEFQTADPLPLTEPRKLYVVHPWIGGLLDRTVTIGELAWEDDSESELDSDSDVNFSVDIDPGIVSTAPMLISRERSSTLPSLSSVASHLSRMDDYARALRLIARLEQPFSALLLQQSSDGKFRRVAAEHEILVRPRQITCARDVQTAVLEVL
ncbi:hypothetical protein JVU11DRAFT_1059 [Chiua virens]|nr:hypothetical protein JVU11DRAFT_1059 [Chiua virens]